jgi:hypothetical protein
MSETTHNFHQEPEPTDEEIEAALDSVLPGSGYTTYEYDGPVQVETDGELPCWQVTATWSKE